MEHIGLVGGLVILGHIIVGFGTAAIGLWMQRRFFLHADEDQSFAVPGAVAFFVSLSYFWMVIQVDTFS